MTSDEEQRYDELIFKQAREIAAECKRNAVLLESKLRALGVDSYYIDIALRHQLDDDYEEIQFDDVFCDEAVYEAIKDGLRPIYGF